MWYRLRSDFQLTIITLFGTLGFIAVLPLSVYRFVTGQLVVGVLDIVILLCFASAVAYAWRTGDTRRVGMFLAVAITGATMGLSVLLGVTGLFWMYATLLANYFLIGRVAAVVVSVLALGFLVAQGRAFETTPEMASFVLSASILSLFAFVFATRTDIQRRQLETLATRDPLTGVDNRRAMERELQIAVEIYKRKQLVFGLIMLDLDHFKRINDGYGHDAGDRVLLAFAELVGKSIRKADRLFRFGGEEFVVLLPGTDCAGLLVAGNNLRKKIAAEVPGPAGPVTASLGAAALLPDEEWTSWLARADAALYRAKERGRDCTVVDGVHHDRHGVDRLIAG